MAPNPVVCRGLSRTRAAVLRSTEKASPAVGYHIVDKHAENHPLLSGVTHMAPDGGALAGAASVIAAFGSAMTIFRVQREDQMRREGERVWLPVADWLLIAATLCSLLLVILPVSAGVSLRLPAAASAASAIAVAGYIPALLAHYRIVFGTKRKGPRQNPEPFELIIVLVTVAASLATALWTFNYFAA